MHIRLFMAIVLWMSPFFPVSALVVPDVEAWSPFVGIREFTSGILMDDFLASGRFAGIILGVPLDSVRKSEVSEGSKDS